MKKSLIIVESPAKIKTLKKFLGSNFIFVSSFGHVIDLPQKEFGIDIEHDFEPQYTILPDKQEVINNIEKAAKQCDTIYLSPDPDREGEAIAWHIACRLPQDKNIKRVSFNAITKQAVTAALKEPRTLDMNLVDAQQARRLLDRIVGYKISPILSRKLQQRSGISAGRVQSVALKLVVDREYEIEQFIPQEYWNIKVLLQDSETAQEFFASLYSVDGLKWEKNPVENKKHLLIDSKEKADVILRRLEKGTYGIDKVEAKEKKRNPCPPFITSTLQQEASRHFRYSSSKTMGIAQSLYEGIDFPYEDVSGLITYMRTDSVRVEPEAIAAARSYVQEVYGKDFIPEKPNVYTGKKSAQDAHEAIRPTDARVTPDKIKRFVSNEQFNLYELIWRRFIASQMSAAIYDTVSVTIHTNDDIVLKTTGSVLKFKGFLAVYEEKYDDDIEEVSMTLPALCEGTKVDLKKTIGEQAFTKPPPRFTEASLVKELEKSGIGRPSTYATIMNKIQSREYTIKEQLRLKPTELGKVIAQFLENNFSNIMNIGFTAHMENELELIADGKKVWKTLIRDFWTDFIPIVESAEKEAFIPKIQTNIPCPSCKTGRLQKIWSKIGYFYGCSGYPDCSYKASEEEINFDKNDYNPDTDWNAPCPVCKGLMKIRFGRYGTFLGCLDYPKCKGTITLMKKDQVADDYTPIDCPATGCTGKILKKKSRFNKTFFSCSDFPECDVIGNTIEELTDKYKDRSKTPYEKKKTGVKTKSTKTKKKTDVKTKSTKTKKKTSSPQSSGNLKKPSHHLAAIIGPEPVSQPEARKKLWDYIKKHNLQDPKDRRNIMPDDNLAKITGSEIVRMTQLPKILSSNLES